MLMIYDIGTAHTAQANFPAVDRLVRVPKPPIK
jgi:hypothetical protein